MQAIEPSKTHRLYLLLKERIVSGILAPGERLPGEPALASAHGLSRITVRRALAGLASDGLVQRKPGAGTFVAGGKGARPVTGDLTDMLAHLAAMGRDTEVRLLSFAHGEPPPAIAEALGLSAGERTQQALRVRSHEGKPFSLLSTHVPERIGAAFGAEELARLPLLTLLEQSGVVADRAVQTITATLAAPDAAAALDVEIGAPLLSLTRVVFDRQNRGVEHLSALYRPDRHGFHMELRRAGSASGRYWRAQPSAPPSHRSSRREAPSRRRSP